MKRVYKFIFAIFLFVLINSNSELVHSITDEKNSTTSNLLIFDIFSDIELELELELDFDSLFIDSDQNNRVIQLTYLLKHSNQKHFITLNNKFEYLQPRAPPFRV